MVDLLKLALKYRFDVLLMVWIHLAREVGMRTYVLILSFLIQKLIFYILFSIKEHLYKVAKGLRHHNSQRHTQLPTSTRFHLLPDAFKAPQDHSGAVDQLHFHVTAESLTVLMSKSVTYKKIMRVIGFLRKCEDEVQSPPPRRLSGVCWQLLCSRLLIRGEKIHRR